MDMKLRAVFWALLSKELSGQLSVSAAVCWRSFPIYKEICAALTADWFDSRTEIIDAAFFSTELRMNPARSQA